MLRYRATTPEGERDMMRTLLRRYTPPISVVSRVERTLARTGKASQRAVAWQGADGTLRGPSAGALRRMQRAWALIALWAHHCAELDRYRLVSIETPDVQDGTGAIYIDIAIRPVKPRRRRKR